MQVLRTVSLSKDEMLAQAQDVVHHKHMGRAQLRGVAEMLGVSTGDSDSVSDITKRLVDTTFACLTNKPKENGREEGEIEDGSKQSKDQRQRNSEQHTVSVHTDQLGTHPQAHALTSINGDDGYKQLGKGFAYSTATDAYVQTTDSARQANSSPTAEVFTAMTSALMELKVAFTEFRSESADREVRYIRKVQSLTTKVDNLEETILKLKDCAKATENRLMAKVASLQSKLDRPDATRNMKKKKMKTMEQENVVCLSAGGLSDADMNQQASEHDVDNEDTLPIPDTQHETKTKSVRTPPIAPPGKKSPASKPHKNTYLKVPSWESESEESQSDGIWQLVTVKKPQRKKSVLYVGRISKECTEKQIEEFVLRRAVTIEERTPTVYAIRIFSKPGSDYNAARLTIDASSRPLLLNRNFWPRPIYSRAWNFEAYRTDQPGEEVRQDATDERRRAHEDVGMGHEAPDRNN